MIIQDIEFPVTSPRDGSRCENVDRGGARILHAKHSPNASRQSGTAIDDREMKHDATSRPTVAFEENSGEVSIWRLFA